MDAEITPEPGPLERAAILVALQDRNEGETVPPAYRSRWRREGILESVEDESES